MRTASQLRQIARQRLDGKWGTSLVVSLLAALLGCYGTYFTVSYSVDSTGELFDGATLNLATLFRSLFGTDNVSLQPCVLCPVRQSGNERYRMRERIKAAYGWA